MINSNRSILVAIACSTLCLFTLDAAAFGTPLAVDGGSAQEHRQPEAATANVDFNGGPLREYVQFVRNAFPGANIVVSDEAAEFHVPGLQLRNVQLSEAVAMLQQVATDPLLDEFGGVPRRLSVDYAGPSILTVRAIRPQMPARTPSPPRHDPRPQTQVHSIVDVLMVFTEADVLTSIETTLGLADDEEPAEIRLHEATGLLIVRGSPHQLNGVRAVVEQLTIAVQAKQSEQRTISLDEHEKLLESMRAELRNFRHAYGRLRDEKRELEQSNERLRLRVRDLEQLVIQAGSIRSAPREQPE